MQVEISRVFFEYYSRNNPCPNFKKYVAKISGYLFKFL